MLKILLDNNAIDKVQHNLDFIKENRHKLDIYVPRSVMGEACENKSYNPTWNVISLLKADVKYLPDAIFVLDIHVWMGKRVLVPKKLARFIKIY